MRHHDAPALFDEFLATEHVGTAGPDEVTGTPALPGLWTEPVRYGPCTLTAQVDVPTGR